MLFSAQPDLSTDWIQTFQIKEMISNEQSSHQQITIFNNRSLGKILMIDDVVQFSEKDEFIYHEMLAHVPLLTHPNPKRVLIIGGGDGACVREAIKYPSIEEIIVIELDAKIVDLCKQNFPSLADSAFDDPRVHLLIDDGYNYLKKSKYNYDVVIVNAPDPFGPSRSLFHRHFFNLCQKVLNPDGILVCLSGSPITQLPMLKNAQNLKKELFDSSYYYFAPAPSQLGGIKAFSISFKDQPRDFLSVKKIKKRFEVIENRVKYYSPEIHKGSFSAPKYLNEELDQDC